MVFNVNPRKRRKYILPPALRMLFGQPLTRWIGLYTTADFERYYIGGSLFLGFGVITVPTALGHFGKNTSRGGKNSFWYVSSPT